MNVAGVRTRHRGDENAAASSSASSRTSLLRAHGQGQATAGLRAIGEPVSIRINSFSGFRWARGGRCRIAGGRGGSTKRSARRADQFDAAFTTSARPCGSWEVKKVYSWITYRPIRPELANRECP